MKEKSYTELMKISAMNRNQAKENFVQRLYIEMLLTEIQLTLEKQKLLEQIDQAIDNRDQHTFHLLAEQYKVLAKRFGT